MGGYLEGGGYVSLAQTPPRSWVSRDELSTSDLSGLVNRYCSPDVSRRNPTHLMEPAELRITHNSAGFRDIFFMIEAFKIFNFTPHLMLLVIL